MAQFIFISPFPPFYPHPVYIISVSDTSLPITSSHRHLELLISSLPNLPRGESFVCVFGNVSEMTAKPIPGGLQCQIPTNQEFNSHVMQEQRSHVQLDINFANPKTTLLTYQVPLLNCGKENSCHR